MYYVKLYRAIFPYQVVPLFGVKKDQTSVAFAAVVLDGVTLLGHFTVTGHTIDLPMVPSFVNMRVNDIVPDVSPVVKVKLQFPVNVAVKTFPSTKFIVLAVPVFPNALVTSA
jgi:hypothetical protein